MYSDSSLLLERQNTGCETPDTMERFFLRGLFFSVIEAKVISWLRRWNLCRLLARRGNDAIHVEDYMY
jgi:hypothetical protein